MAEPTGASPGEDAHQGSPPRMPRWVKMAGIIVGVLILVFLVLQLTGVAGQHGPGRHFSGLGNQPAPVLGMQVASVADVG